MAQDHPNCLAHGEIASRVSSMEANVREIFGRLSQHCDQNGHVTRREIDTMLTDLRAVKDKVEGIEIEQRAGTARLSVWQAVLVALLALGGSIAGSIITALSHAVK
jgi:hypothetical protein